MGPYEKREHDSIVRPPSGRTGRWYAPPRGLYPEPVPKTAPARKGRGRKQRQGKKKRGPRSLSENELAVGLMLGELGQVSARELQGELGDMTLKQVSYSLGVLREHRLVTPELRGQSHVWQLVPWYGP